MERGLSEGWWFPDNSRKAHYLRERDGRTISLCGRWGSLLPVERLPLEPEEKPSKDDCVACRRKLDGEQAKTQALDD